MTGPGGEAARKSIHLVVSLTAAAVAWSLPDLRGAAILAAAAAVALSIEGLRLADPRFAAAFQRRLGPMLRPAETRRPLTGATSLAIGYALAAALFPGVAAVAGILFTGVGDAIAALVGRRWGRHRYRGGKSIEGSAAFFTIALAIAWWLDAPDPGGLPGRAALVAAAVTAVESLTLRVDDNLYLPVVGAAVFRAVAGF